MQKDLTLTVVDQSPVREGGSARDALTESVRLAQAPKAAIAVAEVSQHRRHRLDRLGQRRRLADSGEPQGLADLDQVAKHDGAVFDDETAQKGLDSEHVTD